MTGPDQAGPPEIPKGPIEVMLKVSGAAIALLTAIGLVWAGVAALRAHRAQYADVTATVAPAVSLEAVPWNPKLPQGAVNDFDISADGNLAVSIDGSVFDETTGSPLDEAAYSVTSLAFADGALFGLTQEGEFGYFDEDGLKRTGQAPMQASRVQATTDRNGLFLLQDQEPYGLGVIGADRSLHPLTGAPQRITAVSGTEARHLFASGRELYIQSGAAAPLLLLKAPDSEILGVAMSGDTMYFSTSDGVYMIQGAVALPIVIGVGGALKASGGGLFVLDASNHRLYRIATSS